MSPPSPAKPLALLRLLLIAGAAAWVLVQFVTPAATHAGINYYYRARFLDMLNGRAWRPFVTRALLPTTVRGIVAIAPPELQQGAADAVARTPGLRTAFKVLGWEASAAFVYAIACVLMWLALCGFAAAATALAVEAGGLPDTPLMRGALALAALLGLPLFFRYASYIYDPAQLALFTTALLLIARRNLRAFAAVFALACINKETAVLLIPLAAYAWRGRLPRRRLAGFVVGLGAVYLAIRLALAWAFRNNPGSLLEFHLLDHNLALLSAPWNIGGILLAAALAFLLLYRWRDKPVFLRVGLAGTLLPLAGMAVFFGYLDEWRGYYEAYPFALPLMAWSVLALGRRARVVIESAQERNYRR